MKRDLGQIARRRLEAAWKWTLSFRKKEWEFSDYPVRSWKDKSLDTPKRSRFQRRLYNAQIIGWSLTAGGNSAAEAIDALERNFIDAKAQRTREAKGLPRPGTSVPIEFASSEKMNTHAELSEDFIQRVLLTDWAWLSDESSLWDFHTDRSNEAMNLRIQEVYGVDVSDIQSGNISQILERIEVAQTPRMR
jgi:hypothetical protein